MAHGCGSGKGAMKLLSCVLNIFAPFHSQIFASFCIQGASVMNRLFLVSISASISLCSMMSDSCCDVLICMLILPKIKSNFT